MYNPAAELYSGKSFSAPRILPRWRVSRVCGGCGGQRRSIAVTPRSLIHGPAFGSKLVDHGVSGETMLNYWVAETPGVPGTPHLGVPGTPCGADRGTKPLSVEQRRRRARTGRHAGAGGSLARAGPQLACLPRPGDSRTGRKTPACPRAYRPTAGTRGVSGDARTRPGQGPETAETRPQGIQTYVVPLDNIWSGSAFRNLCPTAIFSMVRRRSDKSGRWKVAGLSIVSPELCVVRAS